MWGYWRVRTLVDWSLCPNFRMSLSQQQWVTSHIMRGHLYHCCPNFLFGMGHRGLWKAWLGREKGATQCQISRILSRGRWRQIYVWCRLLHRARLSETPWTVACQAPLSRGFSRQEYQRRLTFPSPGDLPNPGIKSRSPALQADFLPIWATGEALKEMTTSHGMANMAKTEHTRLWTHQAAAELEVALSCSLSYLRTRQLSRDTKPGLPQRPLFTKRQGRFSSNSWKYLFAVYIILAYSWALILTVLFPKIGWNLSSEGKRQCIFLTKCLSLKNHEVRAFAMGPTQRCSIHTHTLTHTPESTAHPHSLSPQRVMAGVGWTIGCKGLKSHTQAWGPEGAAGPPWASASSWDRTAPCTVDQGPGVHHGSAHWKRTKETFLHPNLLGLLDCV